MHSPFARGGGPALAGPVFLAGLVFLALTLGRLERHDWNPTAFFLVCDSFARAEALPPGVDLRPGEQCYDGQFFYRLALDPFSLAVESHGVRLDRPAYRQQRIAYPVLGWLFSLGRPEATGWAMLAVNYLAVLAIAWAAGRVAWEAGASAWWGTAAACGPGLVLSFSRGCGETAALAGLLCGWVFFWRDRGVWAAACFSLAVLTRETSVILPGVCLLAAMREGRRGEAWTAGIPLVLALAWQVRLWEHWGVFPVLDGGGDNLGLPLAGVVRSVQAAWPPTNMFRRVHLLEVASFLGVLALAGTCVWRANLDVRLRLAWLGNLLLALCLSYNVWVEDWAFLRTLSECLTLTVLVVAATPRQEAGRRAVLAWLAALTLFLAYRSIRHY